MIRNIKFKTLIGLCLTVFVLGSCSSVKDSFLQVSQVRQKKQKGKVVQRKHNTPQKLYVQRYYKEAIRQMDKHGIPASITLAQGILETGSGKSELARYHNNHFGIKCAKSWTGKKTYRKDDTDNDCFRSYARWEDSFEDHSLFLKRKRYHPLFKLKTIDYKAWAKGLQKANYASSRRYASSLISLIERYELYQFDRGAYPSWFLVSGDDYLRKQNNHQALFREIYVASGLHYTLAGANDSYRLIAKDFDLSPSRLAKYNERDLTSILEQGAIVYLEPKHSVASPIYHWHTVEQGESMYSIAQRYGMLLKSLYVLNNKSPEYVPTVGDKLRLR